MNQFNVPILISAFNRPDTTRKIFEIVKKIKPTKLFISIDGSRDILEELKVKEVKEIFNDIDWECEVKKRYHKTNQGLLKCELGAFNWFFDNIEEGIILEDDCIPNESFFKFCEEMLIRYRNDDRIMHISGSNFQRGWKRDNTSSYYASKYSHVWGFATWSKSWKKYNHEMKDYLKLKKEGFFSNLINNRADRNFVLHIMDEAYYNNNSAIDIRWMFTIMKNDGCVILPNENLVRNVGFSEFSTHTKVEDNYMSLETKELRFPLYHPFEFLTDDQIIDQVSDKRFVKWLFRHRLKKYITKKICHILDKPKLKKSYFFIRWKITFVVESKALWRLKYMECCENEG
jgi:hypothetical protein